MRTRYAPLAALLLTSVLCLSACLSGSDPDPKEPSSDTWPELVECVADKIPSAIDQITEALLAGTDPTQALAELAEVHGFDVVACGVSQLVDDWTSPGATQSPERMGAVHRGRAFLQREGITVQTVTEPSSWIWIYPDTPRAGFVPITRDLIAGRPWHTVLAGARGVRS
jgi:hypothetical protein